MPRKKISKKEAKGCRLCQYRVAPPKGLDNKPTPSCCFGFEVNDEKRPNCYDLFTETDYYVKNPDAP